MPRRATLSPRRFIVVAYDVSDAVRRERIATALASCGERVQRSVFECRATPARFSEIRRRIDALLQPGDCVRYYTICQSCERRREGQPPPEGERSAVMMA